LKGDYELKNIGLVEFVVSHSFNVSPCLFFAHPYYPRNG